MTRLAGSHDGTCALTSRTIEDLLADPTRERTGHVTECEACTSAVDRAMHFERTLRAATEQLVAEPLPPAYRLLGGRVPLGDSEGERGGGMRRFGALGSFASLGAVLILAAAAIGLRGGDGGRSGASAVVPVPTSSQVVGPTAATPCEAAFVAWASNSAASAPGGFADLAGLPPAEVERAARAFSTCTLDQLRAANAAWPVSDGLGGRRVLLQPFDKAVMLLCVANGSIGVSETCAAAVPPGASALYRVSQGDTLTAIAMRLGTTVDALVAANPWITDPDVVYTGDLLVVPPSAKNPSGTIEKRVLPSPTESASASP